MFRNEKPQLGRHRQFYQFGVEYFNSKYNCFDDLELILITEEILNRLNIRQDVELQVNFIGEAEDRKMYSDYLRKWIEDKKEGLSTQGQTMIDKNIIRLLDTKINQDKKIFSKAGKYNKILN